MQELIDLGIVGVTSNPAIFEQAIVGSADYDSEIAALAAQGLDSFAIYDQISIADVGEAADLFRPVWEKTGHLDGYVSLEVSPLLASNTDGTVAEGERLWEALARPNVLIKVPATKEGIPAIKALISKGINVNVTLLFSLERYRDSAIAYIEGCESLAARGFQSFPRSVASFFVSRMDALLDPTLAEEHRGKAAVALAQCAYGEWTHLFSGERWGALAQAGAHPQRLLWASTSTKNPAYSPTIYVESLIGPETVNTMPLATVEATLAMANPEAALPAKVAEGRRVKAQLEAAGVNFDAAAETLETEGVEKFVQPFDKLLKSLEAKRLAAV